MDLKGVIDGVVIGFRVEEVAEEAIPVEEEVDVGNLNYKKPFFLNIYY